MDPTPRTRYIRVLACRLLCSADRAHRHALVILGLVCREHDIVDWIYSDAHLPRIDHINCVLFIGQIS